jgi:hypothetical protein
VRLHRFLVPLAAGVVVLGVFVAVAIALIQKRGGGAAPTGWTEVGELVSIKNQAESLAIEGKLPEAHAKYRELFARAQGHDIKDPAYWDLMERAKLDQDRIYVILLAQQDPARVLTPPLPNSTPATGATGSPATTQSFVDVHPPYEGLKPATTRSTSASDSGARPLLAAAAAPAPSAPSTAPVAGSLPGPAAAVAMANLPEPKHFKIARRTPDPTGFSDEIIGESLAQANEFLLAQMIDSEFTQGKELSETYRQGLNALCVYALLNSGQATRDPRLAVTGELMRKSIEKMKLQPMSTDTSKGQQPIVYARSLRAAVLAMANRPEDRDVLKDDVQWLMDAAVDGAYTYDDRYTVRVIKGDDRGVGRGMKPIVLPPAQPLNDGPKPKTLGPPKGDQPAAPPANPGPANPPPPGGAVGMDLSGVSHAIEDLSAPDAPLPLELADGLHDPKTGRELGPPNFPRRYPPGFLPPRYPPQELPEKYGGPFIWDNSNSQYGLLGVWSGAEVGIEVPDAYWATAEKHWMACQLTSGQWPYRKDVPGGRLSMSCAGIASLLVTQDYLEAPSVAKVGRQPSPASASIAKGFAWLENGDNAIDVTGPRTVYLGYTLHALSRVGLTSGYKYFGAHDWYRELARKIVASQWENGAWGRSDQPTADTLIDTAYTVLFLARGRHPIVMNKLRLDEGGRSDRGEWNNRPRDLANLCRFASRELERPLNWQIVSIDRDPADWSDAPILYLASHSALKLSDQEIAKIRAFIDGGGMLFTQADNNSESFNLYVNQLAKKLFPDHELKDLPIDDELYTLQYIVAKANRPRLRAIGNGSRLLWVHSPTDLAVNWQQRAERSKREAFEMGVNLFVYAGGKADLRNRIEARAIPRPNFEPSSTIALARLKYAGGGNWDPEPAAFDRFSRYAQWETSIAVEARPVEIAKLMDAKCPIAHLTGTAAYAPSDAEMKALSDYVNAGGTLIVDSVGGADTPFSDAVQSTILPKTFPEARFEAVPPDHPMLHASFKGMEDVWPPRLRGYAALKLGKTIPPIRMATVGKGRVIYLPLDTTSGLLGSNTWPIFGYESAEAQALMKNIVLWSVENAPQ